MPLEALQRRVIFHAALIMLIGFVAGVGLLISVVGGLEVFPGQIIPITLPGSTELWVGAHLGGMLNALLMIVVALALPVLRFGRGAAAAIGWMMIGTGWANTLFYWVALVSANEALTLGPNRYGPASWLSVIGLVPALVFVFVAIIAFVMIARQATAGAWKPS